MHAGPMVWLMLCGGAAEAKDRGATGCDARKLLRCCKLLLSS